MIRSNVWELVNKEAENIIKAIEKGEVKKRKEFMDYLDAIYNWKIAGSVVNIVDAYTYVNDIEMPWDNETEECTE